ncbi:MAG TPA: hypothetical protein DET40_04680 [Lentisphaeria bacterium]|nr:MAG: hypothetical protein A2X45_21445 [Lentisphaerae bacterium GWF2_50_93]HCE42820.1 hypothetical protein [Lentisphaeria bacterium]
MNKMIAMLVSVLFIAGLYADDKDPAELTQARSTFQTQMKAATTPIVQRYLQQLDALKKSLGAKGDVNAALAVQQEMDSLKESSSNDTRASSALPKYEMKILSASAVDVASAATLKDAAPTVKATSSNGECPVSNIVDGNINTNGALDAQTGSIAISLDRQITCRKLYLFQRPSNFDPIEKGRLVFNGKDRMSVEIGKFVTKQVLVIEFQTPVVLDKIELTILKGAMRPGLAEIYYE